MEFLFIILPILFTVSLVVGIPILIIQLTGKGNLSIKGVAPLATVNEKGFELEVYELNKDIFVLKVRLYLLIASMHEFKVVLDAAEMNRLIESLQSNEPSTFGSSTIFGSHKLHIKGFDKSTGMYQINLSQRIFILGYKRFKSRVSLNSVNQIIHIKI